MCTGALCCCWVSSLGATAPVVGKGKYLVHEDGAREVNDLTGRGGECIKQELVALLELCSCPGLESRLTVPERFLQVSGRACLEPLPLSVLVFLRNPMVGMMWPCAAHAMTRSVAVWALALNNGVFSRIASLLAVSHSCTVWVALTGSASFQGGRANQGAAVSGVPEAERMLALCRRWPSLASYHC